MHGVPNDIYTMFVGKNLKWINVRAEGVTIQWTCESMNGTIQRSAANASSQSFSSQELVIPNSTR